VFRLSFSHARERVREAGLVVAGITAAVTLVQFVAWDPLLIDEEAWSPFLAPVLIMNGLWLLELVASGWLLGKTGSLGYALVQIPLFAVVYAAHGVAPTSPEMINGVAWSGPFSFVFAFVAGTGGDLYRESRLKTAELSRKNEELLAAGAAQRESEALFRQFAESVPIVVWIAPTDGRPAYVNGAYERILGMRRGPKFDTQEWIQHVEPEDRNLVRRSWQALAAGASSDIEYRFRRPDGAVRWVRAQSLPVVGAAGKVTLHLGTIEDITERKEAQLREQALSRSERLTSLGTLVAGVAHEVNNPLTYVMGNIHLARQDLQGLRTRLGDDPAAVKPLDNALRLLQTSHSGGERIVRIVKALREVSRQRTTADREPLRLNAVMQNVHELMRAASPPGVKIQVVTDATDPVVHASSSEMHQALLNLATNAVQAVGPSGAVTIRAHRSGEHAVLSIHDTGPGIPEAMRPRLFTPFFTTKPNGTGLGLSIVHGIVRDHGGDITFETAPGQGTTFLVRLPLAAARQEAKA
jgi:PAS domain S-box-containing protein